MGRSFLQAATPSGSKPRGERSPNGCDPFGVERASPQPSSVHNTKEVQHTTGSFAFMTPKGSELVARPAQQAFDPEGVGACSTSSPTGLRPRRGRSRCCPSTVLAGFLVRFVTPNARVYAAIRTTTRKWDPTMKAAQRMLDQMCRRTVSASVPIFTVDGIAIE